MSSTRGQQDLFDSPPPARRRWGLVPRPFLKWAGGKGQLLGDLLPLVEAAEPFSRYHEPFVGGGALFFELARQGRLGRKKAWISDANPRLIEAYKGVQQDVEAVVQLLKVHAQRHCKDYYYEVRANVPDVLVERAARIIYLNRTCFNGLFRENSKGEFNVPFGRYKNPLICDEVNLRQVAEALARAHVEEQPFESVVERAEPGDLVYFDPPYDPVSKTSSFTSYHRGGFGPECQEQLAEVCKALDRKGVKVILSNSSTTFIHTLYVDFHSDVVLATRAVNSRADRRGAIEELLVRNFDVP